MWRATYPHAGDLYIFRGRRGDLAKILWHDGVGLSLYAKRLDRGKFIWPSANGGRGVDLGRRRWPICSRGSTGGIRNSPGGRKARGEAEKAGVGCILGRHKSRDL